MCSSTNTLPATLKLRCSSPCSQHLAICHYPEPRCHIFSKIQLNLLPSTRRLANGCFPSCFPPPNITCVSRSSPLHVPHVCSCHLDYFDHPNRILYGVKILRLLSFCLVPQRPNYRPHYLIVKHLQPLSRCKVKITFPLSTP